MYDDVRSGTGYKILGSCFMYYGLCPIVKDQITIYKKIRRYKMETQEVQITPMPRIGDKAPEFTAVTTQGNVHFPNDFKGSWVILFSHPADFTPVCTSEFITFASLEEKFAKANTKLVGLSVDGLYSHIAWLRTDQRED